MSQILSFIGIYLYSVTHITFSWNWTRQPGSRWNWDINLRGHTLKSGDSLTKPVLSCETGNGSRIIPIIVSQFGTFINVSEYNKMPTSMIHLVIVVDDDDDDPILLTFMNELKWRSDSTRIIIIHLRRFRDMHQQSHQPIRHGMGLRWDWGQK